ncbi:MAG TPA: RidA family protein [Epsilonproteobacteria bacterium]|nr:RidA family protein [Campylobacterota bacterium]
MQVISTGNAPQAIGPYVQGMCCGNLVFTSGQIALMPNGEMVGSDIKSQTNQVLKNLQEVLQEGGSDLNKVIKTTIFLADMEDFAVVNEIYAQYFQEHKPARSTVAVKTLPKNALIEIECIATRED